jgi:hypothetical protein
VRHLPTLGSARPPLPFVSARFPAAGRSVSPELLSERAGHKLCEIGRPGAYFIRRRSKPQINPPGLGFEEPQVRIIPPAEVGSMVKLLC